jgi:hypothetical protein
MIVGRHGWIAALLAVLALAGGAAPAWGQQWGASEEALRKCEKGDIAECKLIGENLKRQLYAMRPAGLPEVREVERQQYWALGKACDLGDGEACYNLGDARNPTGLFGAPRTPENYAGATAALKRACDTHRIADACRLLAGVLGSRGNPQRDEVAANAYRQRTNELERTQPKATASVPAAPAPSAAAADRPVKPAIGEHVAKYGKVDGLVAAEPGLLNLLLERRAANRGSSVLLEADIAAIRDYLLADGRIDDQERDLLVELTWPDIRAVRVYRASDADPWKGEGTTFSSISRTRRDPLIAMLDNPQPALTWDETDRKATLMRLARTSRTPGMEAPVKALIAGKVAEAAPASTKETGYKPLSGIIVDLSTTAKALEEECKLPQLETDAIRQMFFEAMESGVAQSGADLPRFYSFLKPIPPIRPLAATDLPKVCTEKPQTAGQ